jgi:hypothetical protein
LKRGATTTTKEEENGNYYGKKNRRRRRRFCPRGDKGVVVFAISRFARRRLFVVMWFFVRWKIYFILCVFASLREREKKNGQRALKNKNK